MKRISLSVIIAIALIFLSCSDLPTDSIESEGAQTFQLAGKTADLDDPTVEVLYGIERFTRERGKPVTETREVAGEYFEHFEGPFTLHLVNGDQDGRDGSHRVSSATIVLDGEELFGPSDFNQQVESYKAEVLLSEESVMEVTVRSKPGSYLEIWIEGTLRPGLLSEDWESGAINPDIWRVFGSPQPVVVAPGFNSNYAFDARGDSFCDSGVESQDTYSIAGNSLTFDGRVPATFDHFEDVGVSITKNNLRGGACAGLYHEELVRIRIRGDLNRFWVEYRLGSEIYEETIDDAWHSYEMRMLESGHVEFYRDGVLRYTSTNTIDYDTFNNQHIIVGGRSRPSIPVLIDNVELSDSN